MPGIPERARPRTPLPRAALDQLLAHLAARRHAELESLAAELCDRHVGLGIVYKVLGVSRGIEGADPVPALAQAAVLLPRDAETHKNLGSALLNAGRPDEAVESFRRALTLSPRYPQALAGLGKALRQTGQPREAVDCLKEALRLKHDHSDTHTDLGDALLALGEPVAALASFRRAAALVPGDPGVHARLGDALLATHAPSEASDSYREAIVRDPANAALHVNLGIAERGAGNLETARAAFERATELAPGLAEAHDGLGSVLFEVGRHAEAIRAYGEAVRVRADYAPAHANLGVALLYRGEFAAAASSFERALALEPGRPGVEAHLAAALQQLGRSSEASARAARALEHAPDTAAPHLVLASLDADAGCFDAARARILEALRVEPDSPEALAALANLRRLSAADDAWLAAAERVAAGSLPAARRVPLWYALGKYHDDTGDVERAFESYRTANELERSLRPPHDRAYLTRTVDAVIRAFTRRWIDAVQAAAQGSRRPVFVIGMPRSGTTLVEQILASHPEVHGAGELTYWDTSAAREWPALVDMDAAPTAVGRLGTGYLALLDRLAPAAARVIDKLPMNFLLAGLIHAALPDARFIHIERDPADTCLSIYFQHFYVTHSYANDLGDLAHCYREYERLMAHWRSLLPAEAIHELRYEDLVASPEASSRRLVEFIGLDWDRRCLDYHENARPVLTASRWQVRQPLSSSAIGRASRYARWIGPLADLAPRSRA
jgi:tetratricopeptide (TPR) repeat protein